MQQFLMFYAPFLILIVSIIIAFWIAPKDQSITKEKSDEA